MFYNPFNPNRPAEPALFIDRTDEITDAMRTLFDEAVNINLTGSAGIGKTSFLSKLEEEIRKSHSDTLVVRLFLRGYVTGRTVDLSRLFLLAIADKIWDQIFKGSYSELLELVGQPTPVSAVLSEKKQTFLRVYRVLRSGGIVSQVEESAQIGAKMVLQGSKGEKHTAQYRIDGLYQFEFSRLLAELISILGQPETSRIVLLVDEANYLASEKNREILEANFDILSDRRIGYVFVTFESAKEILPEAKIILHREVHLDIFTDSSMLDQLIGNQCASHIASGHQVLKFSEKARRAIWEKSQGHPLQIQRLCYGAWSTALQEGSTTIDIEHVLATL